MRKWGDEQRQGLDYFPKDVNFYDDFKIMELLGEYGPNGIVIYEVTLCIIYGNGYYIECPDMDQLRCQNHQDNRQQVGKEKRLCVTSGSLLCGYRVIR